jgi:4-aminobutyrate aminotransferase-like enzyme
MIDHPPEHPAETLSNRHRHGLREVEPTSLRTFTPSLAVLAKSAGVFHWTPEGRRLYDFTSGVLVANLGHNPTRWTRRYLELLQYPTDLEAIDSEYFPAIAMTTYNAVTPLEIQASARLLQFMRARGHGSHMEVVMWAASGSEAIQKALWASMARDRTRPRILATRYGFHGKKGLANAVTGSEHDPERDPRVHFIRFPMHECEDVSRRDVAFDMTPFRREWDELWAAHGSEIGTVITEPYLGGGGSYHPPKAYLQALQAFCREKDIVFILDEVQANFGRTGDHFAYETYGLDPDIVVLGKGLGNGVPVAAAVGRRDVFGALKYGEASDTWSANPLNCAAVLATIEAFEERDILECSRRSSAIIEAGLVNLKRLPFVAFVRGEAGGMVWGVEMKDHAGRTANDWANDFVRAAYLGDGRTGDGIHLLGPLAKKVVRVSPPLTITEAEATDALALLDRSLNRLIG